MEIKTKTFKIESDSKFLGQRLDKAVFEMEGFPSRSFVVHLIEENKVKVNGKVLKSSYQLKEGDLIFIEIPESSNFEIIEPLSISLDILFEDSSLIVVNKPAGMVVHPAAGHKKDTLVNALVYHTKDLSMKNEQRPGIVHRIDKDTSGVLVIAKNDEAHEILAQQFKCRSITRRYSALVWGRPKKDSGEIESYIARHPTDRKKFASIKNHNASKIERQLDVPSYGKWAKTSYRVLKYNQKCNISLMEFVLATGRTHQIRVHISELGCPIVGDVLYGADRKMKANSSLELRNLILNSKRFMLHAEFLGFEHPITKKRLVFTRPWPEDILPLFKFLDFA